MKKRILLFSRSQNLRRSTRWLAQAYRAQQQKRMKQGMKPGNYCCRKGAENPVIAKEIGGSSLA